METQKYSIRAARRADLPTVFSLAKAKELDAANHQRAERWWIRDFLATKQPFFVASVENKIVGFILGECATGRVAILHLAVVKPAYRKKGIGATLLEAFEHESRRRKMRCVLSYVSGQKYWERHLEKKSYGRGSMTREYQKAL